jgi:hypothetical protein
MKVYIIILSIILLSLTFILYNIKEEFDSKIYDCVISINVHENINFLLQQFENINKNVNCKYAIILNCNDFMYNKCKNIDLSHNIYVNEEVINKRPYHGSLTNGIYSNIQFALKNFKFNYFIVCSSRNFFDNNMTLSELNKVSKLGQFINNNNNYSIWHWPNFINSLLAKYFIDNNKNLYSSPHEGLMFSYNGCNKIVEFLESNKNIKSNLFNFEGCVEEFSLQTISANYGEPFYYIGNGCCTEDKISINTETDIKFMYKVKRE